ncbi:hypothetical protein N0V90_006561 [Kalmusia sp. IMI 367209]|nr:hypothetical protein N0V90_006561 [Kalmusia sp. IMI 367209]
MSTERADAVRDGDLQQGRGREDSDIGQVDSMHLDPSSSQSKRKEAPTAEGGTSKKQQKGEEKKAPENRGVYATNIPRDATLEEIEEAFKKAGIIDQSVDGTPRIKMYADKEGNFNGEILVVYFKKESVQLAIMRLDGWEFRLGDTSNGVVHVQEADQSYKKHTDGAVIATKLVRKDRKAVERHRAEMNRQLAEWSDDDEDAVKQTYAPKKNKWAKMVIIKKAFQLEDLEEDAAAILEIKEDMRNAAEKYGEVTKVVLYDREPEGILSVRFKEFEEAEAFCKAYNGKGYNNDKLQLSIADDRPRFKKTSKENASDDDVEDNVRRMEAYMNDGEKDDD